MPNIELRDFKHASSFRKVAAVAWDKPRDPTIYGSLEIKSEKLLAWIDLKRRETGQKITVTHAVARAVAIAIDKHRDVNALEAGAAGSDRDKYAECDMYSRVILVA